MALLAQTPSSYGLVQSWNECYTAALPVRARGEIFYVRQLL